MMAVFGWFRRRFLSPPLALWYHEAYRLPVPALESAVGLDTRRADLVAWHLFDTRVLSGAALRTPERIRYADLARVHPFEWIGSLDSPERLGRVFQIDAQDLPVREVLHSMRLACGGTLQAAREVLRTGGVALNLLGGFHHAAPARGAGLCLFNDIAAALATLRSEGFTGRAVVIDCDAHPPDGTAECLAGDPQAWIGSLSGSDWGPLAGDVDETVLAPGCGDDAYLAALADTLSRMPRPDLAFVIAGGDVLAHDRLGLLGLTLDGARRRDLAIAEALGATPAVWLPGGGYHPDAWRVLAGTALALAGHGRTPIPKGADPLAGRFARIALGLNAKELGALDLSGDLEVALGMAPPTSKRLLGFYSAEGLELVFERYGILAAIRRLGYSRFSVEVEHAENGDLFRLHGHARGTQHVLIEAALVLTTTDAGRLLLVNWLTLRHPASRFTAARPRLPNQEVPGLGLLAEITQLFSQMAVRLDLAGVAFTPAHYHVAFQARSHCSFLDPRRQGDFLALGRDLGHLPLQELSRSIDAGRVLRNGQRYEWTPDVMAALVAERPDADDYNEKVEAARNGVRFTIIA